MAREPVMKVFIRSVIIETGTINHQRYIQTLLPLALQDGGKLIDDKFIFQQDGGTAHKDQNTTKTVP